MTALDAGENAEKLSQSYNGDGNVKWYSHTEKQYGSVLTNQTYNYHIVQRLHSWTLIPEKWKFVFSQKPVHKCVKQLYAHNQKLLTTQMTLNAWMVKQSVVYSCTRIPLWKEKKQTWHIQQWGWISMLSDKCQSIPNGNILYTQSWHDKKIPRKCRIDYWLLGVKEEEVGRKVWVTIKRQHQGSFSTMELFLYLHCHQCQYTGYGILLHSSARYYYRRKQRNGHTRDIISYNCMWIYKSLVFKKYK